MADPVPTPPISNATSPTPMADSMTFGSADLRLTGRQWRGIVTAVILAWVGFPWIWSRVERFETGPDYRIPYSLSRDYWLYTRRSERLGARTNVWVVGDSVVWGEYVRADGAWTHFLNQKTDSGFQFVNGGVNGLFPLALEGLARHYLPVRREQRILLQCNPLWMTSPEADLSSEKEEDFNHRLLVPQFTPRLPSYRADISDRLARWIGIRTPFFDWLNHLQIAYFDQKSLPAWTLIHDEADPPHYPNLHRNPLAQITLEVPSEPEVDPQRGPTSPRHHPWATGKTAGKTVFEWVPLDRSLQWAAFQRLAIGLRQRGADVFVMVGPFNEHLMADSNRVAYRALRDGVDAWLIEQRFPHWTPAVLPSELYADASHPLTAGYELLASEAWSDGALSRWLEAKKP